MDRQTSANLDDLKLFCAVARLRSFSEVARQLDMAPATLSRRIQKFEREVDAQLLRRSTRHVEPTDAGALLLERAEGPLRGLEEALDCLAEESSEPRGRLRVTMPADLARHWLDVPLAGFVSRHPEIRLELELTARLVDLVEDGFDLAIRAAEPGTGSLIARPLARMPTALYASPDYLAGLPILHGPGDLGAVNALVLTGRRADREWNLAHSRERATVIPRGNVEVDDMGALIDLVAAGAGVALLPEPLVAEAVATNQLVQALPGWHGPEAAVFAVYLSRRMPMRLRLLLEHLRSWVAEQGNLA